MKASITLRKDRTNNNNECQIYVVISHQQIRKRISTSFFVDSKYWKNDKLLSSHPDYPRFNYKISNLNNLIDLALYESSINGWSVERVAEYISNDGKIIKGTDDFYVFAESYIKNLTIGNAKAYTSTLNMLRKHHPKVLLSNITPYWVRNLRENLQYKKGLKLSTVAFYLRVIRSVYLKAIEDRDTIGVYNRGNHPFLRLVPSKTISANKSLTTEEIKSIVSYDGYKIGSRKWRAQRLFIFDFVMRGLDPIDIALLEKKQLTRDNRVKIDVRYKNRNKDSTSQTLSIKLFPVALEIWNFFAEKSKSKYVFDLMPGSPDIEKNMKTYNSRRKDYGRELNLLKETLKIESDISFKVARHTFATISASKGISTREIGQMLGHSQGSNITEVYINTLSDVEIDLLHKKVIDEVL